MDEMEPYFKMHHGVGGVSCTCVAISGKDQLVVTGGSNGDLKVWNPYNGVRMHWLKQHRGGVSCVDISADGSMIISGGAEDEGVGDCLITMWRFKKGKKPKMHFSEMAHEYPLKAVKLSPDGERYVTVSDDTTARVNCARSYEDLQQFNGHSGVVQCVAWSPNCKHIASGGDDKNIFVWDADTGKQVLDTFGHTESVLSLTFNSTGEFLVSASMKGIIIWDIPQNGKTAVKRRIEISALGARCIALSPDDKRIVCAFFNSSDMIVWDVKTGEQCKKLEGFPGNVVSVAWSPDGKFIASARQDGCLYIEQLDYTMPDDETDDDIQQGAAKGKSGKKKKGGKKAGEGLRGNSDDDIETLREKLAQERIKNIKNETKIKILMKHWHALDRRVNVLELDDGDESDESEEKDEAEKDEDDDTEGDDDNDDDDDNDNDKGQDNTDAPGEKGEDDIPQEETKEDIPKKGKPQGGKPQDDKKKKIQNRLYQIRRDMKLGKLTADSYRFIEEEIKASSLQAKHLIELFKKEYCVKIERTVADNVGFADMLQEMRDILKI